MLFFTLLRLVASWFIEELFLMGLDAFGSSIQGFSSESTIMDSESPSFKRNSYSGIANIFEVFILVLIICVIQ
jgi:hypothetical protein